MEDIKFKIGYIDEENTWISTFQRNLSDQFDVIIFRLNDEITFDTIIDQINNANLDCLVVDYELRESSTVTFNGDEIIRKIREIKPDFPVLIITGHEEDEVVPIIDDTDIVRTKEELAERPELFIKRLLGKIHLYKNKINDINSEIETLVNKKLIGGLTMLEEDTLNSLYNELDRINPEERALPAVMYERKNISQLNDLILGTQKLLDEIKNKKS